ncbi:alpha/beta fold hydrolase [Polyangium sp. 15x6]|nr:alpha/beta fold hydrolase [Polyangium sp. 15x6]
MRLLDRKLAARAWPALALVLMGLAAACGSSGETTSSGLLSGGHGGGGGVLTGVGVGGSGGASSVSSSSSSGEGGSGGSEVKLGPPYPIVLSHGFFGFEDFAGAGFATYFYEIKDHLASQGEVLVFTPAVDPFNTSDFRGAQLVEHIEQILAITGHEKVNVIGHSQGGLDARVAANLRPDLVASVVTVATPHGGSRIADIALDLVSDPAAQDVVSELLELIGAPLYDEFGEQTNVWKPLELFSQPGITAFNKAHPDEPGVFYASIAGRTDLHLGGDICDADVSLPFIAEWQGKLDTVDPLLSLFETILDGGFGDPYPNDGLVRVVDSKRGEFWGCLPVDHLDEVGQLFGDAAGIGNGWKHKVFYADVVAELRKRGF